MPVSQNAMLVNDTITTFTASKHDKKITHDVAQAHNTVDVVGRYNKNLLPIDAPSYKKALSECNAARGDHYTHTLPWNDDGARILPATNYLEYTQRMTSRFSAIDIA